MMCLRSLLSPFNARRRSPVFEDASAALSAQDRRFAPSAHLAGQLFFTVIVAGVVGGALFHALRDPALARLLDRETELRYAYEDRLAELRLRLDQAASRQVLDQEGVEGKLRNLVIRQAQLETRAAVVAELVEKTVAPDGVSSVTQRPRLTETEAAKAPHSGAATPAEPLPQIRLRALDDDFGLPPAKPRPESAEGPPAPRPSPGRSLDHLSMAPAAMWPQMAAADPSLPLPARLADLSAALDRIERQQSERLSGVVKPAQDAASRLRQAFNVAGLPAERYVAARNAAVGGPFVAAPASRFERELVAAQTAVAALDGLRRALPHTPLRKPLGGPLQMTSTFGYRTDPFLGRPALHSGVDLRDDYGAPVKATAAGVVTQAGPNGGYGNMVEIDHGGGLATRYAHLSAISVTPGQRVAPGGVIGRVGSTGRSTGPHLHYEVRMDGEAVDPARFLRAATTLAEASPPDGGRRMETAAFSLDGN